MKHLILSAMALLMAGAAWAQDIQREELRRADVPGSDTMEVVVTRLTVPVGATIPLHTHPGDEHAIVMTAARAEAPNGNIVEFAVGTPLYFPEGQVHGGLTNMGDEPMVAITTHVVRKGEPLTVLAN
ncbi:cupin domain-containing protein [uncultured Tateyamaria sp.]|uniref:cupin domain-containing protein n=1 Tax=uncultured Tateyamaria sp. TaxID=455651 RepID=UPI00261EE732|nr:cupin domain-containing protein [uncultured Tateyamaria sp.]